MKLDVIAVYQHLDDYISEMEKDNDTDLEYIWDKYAIKPYWDKISQWAPFDMSDRKPKPIKDIKKLKLQIEIMKEMDLDLIVSEFIKVPDMLPNYDDDPIVIAIYPFDDDNTAMKERQNGVLGTCVFGSIIIHVNPFAEDYFNWIPFVFAHEYHHCVWGNYWHVVHGGSTGNLLEALLTDGQADSFAKNLYPTLYPKWISQISKEQESELWDRYYSILLYETDFDYAKYMFGNEKEGLPWCTGYFFGYQIIDSFRKQNPHISMKEMLEMSSEEIYTMSKYGLSCI